MPTRSVRNTTSILNAPGCLWARWGLDPARGILDGIYVQWERGVFTRVEEASRPPRECPAEARHERGLLTPGLLNAHAHLDYSFLLGMLPRGRGLLAWLRALLAARRAMRPDDAPARRLAARQAYTDLIGSGVTEVWDVSTFGWGRQALLDGAARALTFEEVIAPRQFSWEPAWDAWQARFNLDCAPLGPATEDRVGPGISPHSAYTVCPPALEAAAAFAARHRLPLAMHLAESPEEAELFTTGAGALAELLGELSGGDPVTELGGGRSAIMRAHQAGALGPQTLAIHCNLPQPGDAELLGAAGAVVVFCPRSHAFFGYPPYPLAEYRQARLRLALGTDSLASNDGLDMREEMRAFAMMAGGWSPLQVLAVATGAAIGERPPYGGRGLLEEWKAAQWALWIPRSLPARPGAESLFEALLAPQTRLAASSATPSAGNEDL